MIPNYLPQVQAAKVKYADAWKHAHVEGDPRRTEWIQLCAADIHALDASVGCNGKRGNPQDLSADALNILCTAADSAGRTPEGLPCAVIDVIAGAGGPNPSPVWNPFTTLVEGSGANVVPKPPTPQPVVPSYESLGGDAFFRANIGVPLQADMALVGQTLNDGSSVWFSRTCYDCIVARFHDPKADLAPICLKHRNEWRAILGLPPI